MIVLTFNNRRYRFYWSKLYSFILIFRMLKRKVLNNLCRCEINYWWYSYFILFIVVKILFVLFIQVFYNVNLIHFKWRHIFIFLRPSWKIFNDVRFQKLILLFLRVNVYFRLWKLLHRIPHHKPIYYIFLIETLSVIWGLRALCFHWVTSLLIYLFTHNIWLHLRSACIQFNIFFHYFFVFLCILKQMPINWKIESALRFLHCVLQLFKSLFLLRSLRIEVRL